MGDPKKVNVFDSQGGEYERAFQVFLNHTDQKARAREWLDRLVQKLPSRRVFLDAGAGNGKVTSWFIDRFEKTLAIEPNDFLRKELRRTCDRAEILSGTIMEASPPAHSDLILCSHVFYYIEGGEWMDHLKRLASWLSPDGVLVVVLQNHNSDCMRMLDHFFGRCFNLSSLEQEFQAKTGHDYQVALETVPAHIATKDFDSAYLITEFMLNLLPITNPPSRAAVEEYILENFRDGNGGFRFSCNQDFLRIRNSRATSRR